MEPEKPWTATSAIIAVDASSFCYRVCSACERTLSGNSDVCGFCDFRAFNPGTIGSRRVYRILVSIASGTEVFVVICFDRAARVLFGCSADEFFDFVKRNPFAGMAAGKVLEGELFRVTLSKPKNGNAQHLRVASIVPLRPDFKPAIVALRRLYG
ncbi:hypothetical protein Syun_000757 [Stephania yunnanensis]|uniref:Replication factor A C-terminal domain-containing protein n=1 Tax=Stephania yunnanensis TaxID=152371 RepID=A0AAP0LE98_9MAGN